MEKVNDAIINLLKNEIVSPGHIIDFSEYSDDFLRELYNVAITHNVVHIIGYNLLNNGALEGKLYENLYKEQVYAALYRYETLLYDFEEICNIFEKNKIPFIPLKGAVIKDFYPEVWMRIGSDIDILVKKSHISRAIAILTETSYFRKGEKSDHDVSVISTENINVELHFTLSGKGFSEPVKKILDKVWDYATPVKEGSCRYKLDDSFFYFFHIAHTAKHFTNGGCGIKPLLDLWLIEKKLDCNNAQTQALLEKGKILHFAKEARKLALGWFSEGTLDDTCLLMQDFIFKSGCFGTNETYIITNRYHYGNKAKYIISRLFVSYNELKRQYPIIQKHKILTPIYQIRRLIRLISGEERHSRIAYLKKLFDTRDSHIDSMNRLFKSLGF